MSIYFFKYQGAGNDFILIDERHASFDEDKTLIGQMCDRHFGIGSDGILLLKESEQADIHLDFINPDGTRSFCGNGSRCGIRFAHALGMIGEECTFEAIDGIHQARVTDDAISISMNPVEGIIQKESGFLLDTGSPHLVIKKSPVDDIDVRAEGALIRYSDEFKHAGVNVNFVELIEQGHVRMRTYERGVEDETLSCGTGVTAAALVHAMDCGVGSGSVKVSTRGGELKVDWVREGERFKDIWLTGPAVRVFAGEFHP